MADLLKVMEREGLHSEHAAQCVLEARRRDSAKIAERVCSHCRFPLPESDSGLRHYGTHTAHQESECLNLLRAEIDRLTLERNEWSARWHAERRKYAELRWPGRTGVVRAI